MIYFLATIPVDTLVAGLCVGSAPSVACGTSRTSFQSEHLVCRRILQCRRIPIVSALATLTQQMKAAGIMSVRNFSSLMCVPGKTEGWVSSCNTLSSCLEISVRLRLDYDGQGKPRSGLVAWRQHASFNSGDEKNSLSYRQASRSSRDEPNQNLSMMVQNCYVQACKNLDDLRNGSIAMQERSRRLRRRPAWKRRLSV